MTKSILFVFLIAITIYSCDKEKVPDLEEPPKDEVEIQVYPYFGTKSLELDSVYVTNENYLIQFTDIKFYVGNMKNGSNVLAGIAFFDYSGSGNKFLRLENDYSKFSTINAILGVDSIANHSDPSAFPASSPLNILNAGDMHWDWNPGYIFMKVDAKVDTIQDGITNLDHFITYHVGKDENKIALSFANINWVSSGEYLHSAKMKLDLQQFLTGPNSLDLKTEYRTHTEAGKEALSLKVIQNFAAALRME